LSDFDPAVHAVKTENLADIDKYMLGKLTETVKEVKRNDGFELYCNMKQIQ
jgi:isoleucyl-tRNA synthetase